MIHNLATGSVVIAIFSGACAFGVGEKLGRIMRPLMYGAFAVAVALYVADYFV